ncbi:riboflavin synthase subunit alpha [Gallibacterium salpingitidis]|uniref:Riboflavin synthase n=1 Tax=Gallibacterium salpingitidis TaxID=505341 RepID=A0AB36E0B8_9PAST|nr:riboflavin synthase [Gallibacterium salpingitidis]OBX07081.1 riboflavin synthase subunit alpha [Gallibacterium salpingitidis]OBX07897.1 riboflavin synthase subunit alpha [Gallibacterium salpingitidis]WKT00696.1 riboflavin synthase [Gallibacterium salpingitidis]
MFTGIIQGKAKIQEIKAKDNFRTHIIKMPQDLLDGLTLGASVAHNGVCLTVTAINHDLISFDLMQETLKVTNLGDLQVGDEINIERAMKIGDEVGGHLLSGHVYCTATVADIIRSENNCQIWFKLPNTEIMKYILTKGYVAVDGISLTIGAVKDQSFCVNLIPETLQRTTIGQKQLNDKVNIELDSQTQAVVDTVERYLSQQK